MSIVETLFSILRNGFSEGGFFVDPYNIYFWMFHIYTIVFCSKLLKYCDRRGSQPHELEKAVFWPILAIVYILKWILEKVYMKSIITTIENKELSSILILRKPITSKTYRIESRSTWEKVLKSKLLFKSKTREDAMAYFIAQKI